jgi:AraC-like DNA-binding protein
MFADSVVTLFDPKTAEGASASPEAECRFWCRPDGQIHIQHFRPAKPIPYPPHTHSEYNLVICLAGAVSKTQMGITEVIEPGEAMMGNFGVEHASCYLTGSKGCQAVCVTVDRRILAGLLHDSSLPRASGDRSPVFLKKIHSCVLYSCALDIAQELGQHALGRNIVLDALAMRMMVETLRSWPRSGVELCAVDSTPRLPRRDFIRAYEFMRWCRKDAFRLQQLCQFLGTSEERFTRLFRAATNTSPANFYNRMLLERGRDLLQNRALSVKEVGYLLGFKTSSHFVFSFHRQFGMTPLEWRNSGMQTHAVVVPQWSPEPPMA